MADFDPVSYMMGQKAAGGGGGGSSTLSGLTDVDISNPSDGQTLVYNATSGKWENGGGSGGGVLVVQVDEQTGVLDKTWQEIHDAAITRGAIIVAEFAADGVTGARIVWVALCLADPEPLEGTPKYTVVDTTGAYEFWCSSANGYPVMQGGSPQ